MAITCQSPYQPMPVPKATPDFVSPSPLSLSIPKQSLLRCNTSFTTTEPQPVFTFIRSFAPAIVANLGPGFDFLGCVVDGLGDFVSLTVDPVVRPDMLSISELSSAKLSKDPLWNCAGIAAIAAMKMLNIRSIGLSLPLEKGLPLGSGLGSSAASVATAVVYVNEIFGRKLQVKDLVLVRLELEAKVSGYQADNIAPVIMVMGAEKQSICLGAEKIKKRAVLFQTCP